VEGAAMYEKYFQQITNNLDVDDLMILDSLKEDDANVKFKAMKNTVLFERSGMSEAKYRKTIARLSSISFIEANTTNKEHALFITEYGMIALQIMIKKAEG
jgi:RIO-like serine/threonine protein kinase